MKLVVNHFNYVVASTITDVCLIQRKKKTLVPIKVKEVSVTDGGHLEIGCHFVHRANLGMPNISTSPLSNSLPVV